jgi:hypothetical protein
MVPVWAGSMIQNYRREFKDKYGRDTKLDDDAIWSVCNSVYDDSDNDKEVAARLEVMAERDLIKHL